MIREISKRVKLPNVLTALLVIFAFKLTVINSRAYSDECCCKNVTCWWQCGNTIAGASMNGTHCFDSDSFDCDIETYCKRYLPPGPVDYPGWCYLIDHEGSCYEPTEDNCISELIYDEYSDEIGILRHFRDNVLSKTPVGQEIIKLYYQWSPVIVKAMEEDEEFKEEIKEMIDRVLPLIRTEGE